MCKKAQSINEYAMVIAIITLAAVSMQTYVKRGIQGVIKLSADDLMVWSNQTELAKLTPKPKLDLPDGDYYYNNNPANPFKAENWHPAAIEYVEDYGGFIHAEKTGNEVSYYHFTTDLNNQTLIGKEDVFTRDFTGFDIDGFACGVRSEFNTPYIDLTFSPGVTSVTVKRRIRDPDVPIGSDGIIPYLYIPIGTYGKYEMVKLSSSAAGEAAAQQKGIEETGLYSFKMADDNPLKVTSNKSITVKQYALKATIIPQWKADGTSNYHPAFVSEYLETATVPIVERTGNDVYYYDYPTLADAAAKTNGITVGGEDAITRDFTSFGPEGYPDVVFDKDGYAYDIGFIRTKNAAGEIISVRDTDGNTYKKYQIVRRSTTPVPPGSALPDLPVGSSGTRETIINNDKTTVSGAWEATYKLGAETFGALEKKLGDDKVPDKLHK